MSRNIALNSDKYKILTPSGWSDFSGISKQSKRGSVVITAGKEFFLECTLDHPIKTRAGFKQAENLTNSDFILTSHGWEAVQNVLVSYSDTNDMYDALEVEKDHEYFTNDIVSHNCEFMGSSGTLIAGWKLKELASLIPLVDRMGITQYVRPIPLHNYVCIVDVSRGKGLDYSAFQIIDVTTMPYIQVCTYRDNMSVPTDYAETVHLMCITYNTCPVLVEINDIGGEVADLIQYDYEYENILYTESAGRVGKRITSGFGKNVDKGIRTTTVVKSIGCSLLKLLVEQNQLILNDFNTISELTTFSRKGKSYEAEPGCHDDLVMGLVLFAWLTGQPYFKEFTDINTLMKLRERSEEQIMEDLLPFGFVVSGEEVLEENPIHEGGFMVGNDW